MCSLVSTSRKVWISLGLSLALGVWGLGWLGTFEAIDGIVYDAFMRVRARTHHLPSQVLLVEIDDPSYLTEEDHLIELLSIIREKNPKKIVFNFLPSDNFLAFFKMAEQHPGVVFGRAVG